MAKPKNAPFSVSWTNTQCAVNLLSHRRFILCVANPRKGSMMAAVATSSKSHSSFAPIPDTEGEAASTIAGWWGDPAGRATRGILETWRTCRAKDPMQMSQLHTVS